MVFNAANSTPSIDRTASDGVQGDNFGISVAISGDYAVVGSPNASVNGNTLQGAAYVFVRTGNTWKQDIKLTNFSGAAYDQFGWSVAISGNNIVIGSPYDDVGSNIDQGSAHVFVRSGGGVWSHTQLFASDGATADRFGQNVAISGNYALIGSVLGNHFFVDQGSAYIFTLSGSSWIQQAKLIASDGAAYDQFGTGVAISGNYALVGCSFDDIGSNIDQGSAYVFMRSGSSWIQQAKLTASDGATNYLFGHAVGLSGDYAIVGNSFTSSGGAMTAYIFMRLGGGWTQQARLTAATVIGDHFSFAVAISGNYALVGSPDRTVGGNPSQGSAYLYERSGTNWSLVRQITDNSRDFARNGFSLSISNGTFIIGGYGSQISKGKVGFGTVDN
jgi:hypothetical protein